MINIRHIIMLIKIEIVKDISLEFFIRFLLDINIK